MGATVDQLENEIVLDDGRTVEIRVYDQDMDCFRVIDLYGIEIAPRQARGERV